MKTSIDPKTNESSWKKFSLLHIKVMYSKAGPRLNEKNDCDCVNTSHLVTILTTTTILFFLTSVMMLFFTINFYKKSKILLETTCKNRNISTKKHKINSFTCLELREIPRILFISLTNKTVGICMFVGLHDPSLFRDT